MKQNPKYTYADYLTWNDNQRWEIIEGKRYALPSGNPTRHQTTVGNIIGLMGSYFKSWPYFGFFLDVRLGETPKIDESVINVVQPDIVGVYDESKLDNKGVTGSPDILIEILAPESMEKDWREKYDLYEKYGVRSYWIIDPGLKAAHIYILNDAGKFSQEARHEYEGIIESAIYPGLKIDLKELFKDVDQFGPQY
ncbi:MAG: Uma2 family endonuclease [bacterium]|nr:Uma2 family endonuclease [bacterium]